MGSYDIVSYFEAHKGTKLTARQIAGRLKVSNQVIQNSIPRVRKFLKTDVVRNPVNNRATTRYWR